MFDYSRANIPFSFLALFKRALSIQFLLVYILCLNSIRAYSENKLDPDRYLDSGNRAFLNQDFQQALVDYRKHLRIQPNDTASWNLIGATYYHLAQPLRALRILKKFQKNAKPKSLNFFYQGLCYDALEQEAIAIKYLSASSNLKGPYAILASFELIAISLDQVNYKAALNWIQHYKKQFPNGPHLGVISEIETQLNSNTKPEKQLVSQRALYKKRLFVNHPWSLFESPHFWLFYLGYDYTLGTRSNPALAPNRQPIIDKKAFEQTNLRLRAALGLGPFKNKESSLYIGYAYKQDWETNRDRLQTFIEDPVDLSYFPFRPDLQLRTHRLFTDIESKMNSKFSVGLYSYLEFIRAGSSIYPAPERPEIRKSLDVSYSTKMIPWLSFKLNASNQLQAYSLFEKEINQEQSDFSKQTYRILDTSRPFLSLGFAYQFKWESVSLRTDLYRFEFLFNDSFENHIESGFTTNLAYKLNTNWTFKGRFSYFQDSYLVDQIQTNNCGLDFTSQSSFQTINCKRVDTGQIAQLIINYQPKPSYLWSISGQYRPINNSKLEIYNENRFEFYASFIMGFPDIGQAMSSIQKFSETEPHYEGF